MFNGKPKNFCCFYNLHHPNQSSVHGCCWHSSSPVKERRGLFSGEYGISLGMLKVMQLCNLHPSSLINARRTCAQRIITVLTLCVYVCYQFAAFISTKYDIPACFFFVNFVDFEKKPSLQRKSAFHNSLVVYSRCTAPYTTCGQGAFCMKRTFMLSQQLSCNVTLGIVLCSAFICNWKCLFIP